MAWISLCSCERIILTALSFGCVQQQKELIQCRRQRASLLIVWVNYRSCFLRKYGVVKHKSLVSDKLIRGKLPTQEVSSSRANRGIVGWVVYVGSRGVLRLNYDGVNQVTCRWSTVAASSAEEVSWGRINRPRR